MLASAAVAAVAARKLRRREQPDSLAAASPNASAGNGTDPRGSHA
jgi:hypothetical protein